MEEIAYWRDELFGATHPVLGDLEQEVWDQYSSGFGQPQYIVFDRDLTVRYKNRMPDALPDVETAALSYL